MTYRPDIDGLRALAIGLVVIFHFNIFSLGKAGFIGVDVFFVLSGFLITGIILRDLRAGRFSYPSFLYRRVRRLYPAMLATLIPFAIYGYIYFLPPKFAELAIETVLSQIYATNIYFWRTVNYFGLQAGEVPLLHTWSLAVEEQFYLLFPLFCVILYRWGLRVLGWAIVLACLGSFALGLIAAPIKPWAAFYLLPTRAWELLAGSILALYVLDRTPPRGLSLVAGPVGLALVALGVYLYTPATPVPGSFALLPTLGAVGLIMGGFHAKAPLTRLFSWPVLVWIGKISYPLYLVHWPVKIALQDALPEFTLPWRAFGLGLSVLLAWVIYRFIETPIRSGTTLPAPRRFVGATVAATVALVAGMGTIYASNGAPQRFDPEVSRILAYAEDSATAFRHCNQLPDSLDQMCRLGTPDTTPTVLIFGDSHANALARSMDLWLAETGRAGLFLYAPVCLPVLGAGRAQCTDIAERMMTFTAAEDQITEVMLVSAWRHPFVKAGMQFDGRFYGPDQTPMLFDKALTQTVSQIVAAGKRPILIEPMFAAENQVPETLAKNLAFGHGWTVNKTLTQHQSEFPTLFDSFASAQALGATRVSLIDGLCNGGTCRALMPDGAPLFSDIDHIADSHAPYFAKILTRALP